MKKGDWIFDGQEQFGKAKSTPYEVFGCMLVDVVLYGRDGTRIGRISPAEGGPTDFEPACDASWWTVIEKPQFPLPRLGYLSEMLVRVDGSASTTNVIHDTCSCGEPVLVETGLVGVCRRDGKRPHHPGDAGNVTAFRCRKCHGWLADTCASAAFEPPTQYRGNGHAAGQK